MVPLNAAKQRALLAILLLHANELGLERPPDRGSVGRTTAGHRGEDPAEVRLSAPPGAGPRRDPDRLLGVRARYRRGVVRPTPVRAARSKCARLPPRRKQTRCCGRRSRSGEASLWPSSPTSPGRSPRSEGSRSFGSKPSSSGSRLISRLARAPSSSASWSCWSASTRYGSASAPSSCSPSTAREGRRTPWRRIAMRGARSWRRSASSRRSRSGSSNARSSTRIRRSISSPPSPQPTAQRSPSPARRVARRPSWGEHVS